MLESASSPTANAMRAILAAALLLALCSTAADTRSPSGSVTIDGLQWALSSNGEDLPWSDAQEYCDSLSLDGHDDWRLPTLSELESLHEPSGGNGHGYPSEMTADACCVWSASTLEDVPPDSDTIPTYGEHSRYAWGFLFDGGFAYFSGMFIPDGQALCTRDAG